MFRWKREHVERIAAKAEAEAAAYVYEPRLMFNDYNAKKLYTPMEDVDKAISKAIPYYGTLDSEAKVSELNKWKEITLTPNADYRYIPANMNYSAVHIPVNVYNERVALMNSLKWSSRLTQIFENNKNHDNELSWQFFCSSEGYLRLYPAAKWRVPKYLANPDPEQISLDLYDCRMRNWFIKAAASPKDIVVLLDRSGSMTGKLNLRPLVLNLVSTDVSLMSC